MAASDCPQLDQVHGFLHSRYKPLSLRNEHNADGGSSRSEAPGLVRSIDIRKSRPSVSPPASILRPVLLRKWTEPAPASGLEWFSAGCLGGRTGARAPRSSLACGLLSH